MLRLFLRFLAYISLSLAIIAAVLDAARSVGASHLVVTPLQESWLSISAPSLALVETAVKTHLSAMIWDPVMLALLQVPTVVVFAFLALLFYMAGYRRTDGVGRFAR